MDTKNKFTLTIPSGSSDIVFALWIVYGGKVALETLSMFFVLGTIWENWL